MSLAGSSSFSRSGRSSQPAPVAHDVGDLAAHVELADAVGVVVLLELVGGFIGGNGRCGQERQDQADRTFHEHDSTEFIRPNYLQP